MDQPQVTRRTLLGAAAASAVALGMGAAPAAEGQTLKNRPYLTDPDRFGGFIREKPKIYELSPQKLRQVGLHPDTWQLEVTGDPESNSKIDRPLTRSAGTALDWTGLMKLAQTKAVRFLMTLTCTNADDPFGTGLWEGVPLREVVWLTRPGANVRRVFYFGYHNDQPAQRFVSSLTMSRVLEDPPGELPAILCYKLNGQSLSTKLGGPVRMIVPGGYANKSVKWLQRLMLTNSYQANDTYATWNNDTESPMKSCARLVNPPKSLEAGQTIELAGFAQVGIAGLAKVQYALHRQNDPLPADDPYLTKLDWHDAQLLPPPPNWGGGLPDGKLPPTPLQFDPATGQPRYWPLRYTTAHWTATAAALAPGKYYLRCRAVDLNGMAQPLPRPLPKSGNNAIQKVELVVA